MKTGLKPLVGSPLNAALTVAMLVLFYLAVPPFNAFRGREELFRQALGVQTGVFHIVQQRVVAIVLRQGNPTENRRQ